MPAFRSKFDPLSVPTVPRVFTTTPNFRVTLFVRNKIGLTALWGIPGRAEATGPGSRSWEEHEAAHLPSAASFLLAFDLSQNGTFAQRELQFLK